MSQCSIGDRDGTENFGKEEEDHEDDDVVVDQKALVEYLNTLHQVIVKVSPQVAAWEERI